MGIIKVLETIGQMSSDETSKDEACLGLKGGSFSEKWRYFSVSHCIPHTMYQHVSSLACEYMVVVQNSFFSKRPFLAEKKITLAKLSPYSQKTFAGPYACLSDHQNSFCGGCAFTCGVLPLSVVLAHLLWPVLTLPTETKGSPASCLSGNKT